MDTRGRTSYFLDGVLIEASSTERGSETVLGGFPDDVLTDASSADRRSEAVLAGVSMVWSSAEYDQKEVLLLVLEVEDSR